ncbi:MAG: hypothetical protein IJ779_09120 [Ruminococcus sp.]|nr:hypothetical protein [Ruminococcus sp.]
MKAMLKKAAAVLSSAMVLVTAVGCADKDDHDHDHNLVGSPADGASVAEEDLPYGATMTSLKSSNVEGLSLDAEFDSRYFAQEGSDYPEIYLLADYLTAVQDSDADALEKLFYPSYLETVLKERGYASTKEYLDNYHERLVSEVNSSFKFEYLTVDACLNENESNDLTEFRDLDTKLDSCAGETVSDKVKSRKLVYLDAAFEDEQGNFSQLNSCLGNDLEIYIYNIDGKYYLF